MSAPRRRLLAAAAGWFWPALAGACVLLPLAFYFAALLRAPRLIHAFILAPPGEFKRLGYLLGRTTWLATLTATLALLLALVVFVAVEPALARRRLWPLLFMMPLLVPGHFAAVAWIQWLGFAGTLTHWLGPAGASLPLMLYSVPGVAFVMALKIYPLALGFIYIGWRGAGTGAVEAASVLLPPGRLWRRFLGGWLRPWLAAAWLLVFIAALLDYSIPSLMRLHVFSVEIVSAFNVYYKPEVAMAMALPLLALSLAGAAALGWVLARVQWPVPSRRPCRLPALSNAAAAALGLGATLVGIGSLILPTVLLMRMAHDWEAFEHIWAGSRDQMLTSMFWSAVATAGVLACAAGLATRGLWSRRRRPAIPVALMLFLYAMPPSVVAMAFIRFYNTQALGALYDSGAMLPLGLATVHLPIAWLIFHVRLREIPARLVELQALAPLPAGRRWWQLVAPLLARPALVAAGLVFVLALNEVQASLLLAAPGQATMSVRAMTLLHYAPDRLVAAYCLIAWAAGLAPVLLLAAVARLAGHFWRKLVPHHELD